MTKRKHVPDLIVTPMMVPKTHLERNELPQSSLLHPQETAFKKFVKKLASDVVKICREENEYYMTLSD